MIIVLQVIQNLLVCSQFENNRKAGKEIKRYYIQTATMVKRNNVETL